ncbi:MAG TPA: MerR family transcriptional regulator [Bacteroidia bacterium]|nr:MerR family transcriptional regulator [Bacteroidia bacterium]
MNHSLFIEFPREIAKISTNLKIKCFGSKDCGLSYRTIGHYQELKIIGSEDKRNKTWVKFSGVEIVWIRIIIQLRNLGISLEKVKKLHYQLFESGKLGSIDKIQFISNSFEHEIALVILKKYDLNLIIFSDFSYTFQDSQTTRQQHVKMIRRDSFINIPLTPIILKVYSETKEKLQSTK